MSQIIQAVDRALTILETLSGKNEGLTVTQISHETNLHKSTVYRLLKTLIYKGFITQNPETNKYNISLKLYELGIRKVGSSEILTSSKFYIRELMKVLNESVHLVVRDNTDIVYIDKVEADNTIRMASTIGKRNPMYSTSVGKSMLAFMDEETVEQIWTNTEILKLTKNTIVDLEEFKRELVKIAEKGYAVDNEENELGVMCIGAPIFNRNGGIEGAISVSGPKERIAKKNLEKYAEEVIKCANLISSELGYIK